MKVRSKQYLIIYTLSYYLAGVPKCQLRKQPSIKDIKKKQFKSTAQDFCNAIISCSRCLQINYGFSRSWHSNSSAR